MFKLGAKRSKSTYVHPSNDASSLSDSLNVTLRRQRKSLNTNVNMNVAVKQKKPMPNVNAFVKPKRLTLKHRKKKRIDEPENKKLELLEVRDSQDFQVVSEKRFFVLHHS